MAFPKGYLRRLGAKTCDDLCISNPQKCQAGWKHASLPSARQPPTWQPLTQTSRNNISKKIYHIVINIQSKEIELASAYLYTAAEDTADPLLEFERNELI